MNFSTTLRPGVNFRLVLPRQTRQRLAGTCFRGKDLKLAGNLHRWGTPEELFRDHHVLRKFRDHLEEIWDEKDFGKQSCVLEFDEKVGWSSTDRLTQYHEDDLENCKLNRKSTVLRVKTDRHDILAPQTSKLTLVFQMKLEGSEPVVIIFSVYPGEDVGELKGNVTEREQCVFFDWGHPGAE